MCRATSDIYTRAHLRFRHCQIFSERGRRMRMPAPYRQTHCDALSMQFLCFADSRWNACDSLAPPRPAASGNAPYRSFASSLLSKRLNSWPSVCCPNYVPLPVRTESACYAFFQSSSSYTHALLLMYFESGDERRIFASFLLLFFPRSFTAPTRPRLSVPGPW